MKLPHAEATRQIEGLVSDMTIIPSDFSNMRQIQQPNKLEMAITHEKTSKFSCLSKKLSRIQVFFKHGRWKITRKYSSASAERHSISPFETLKIASRRDRNSGQAASTLPNSSIIEFHQPYSFDYLHIGSQHREIERSLTPDSFLNRQPAFLRGCHYGDFGRL